MNVNYAKFPKKFDSRTIFKGITLRTRAARELYYFQSGCLINSSIQMTGKEKNVIIALIRRKESQVLKFSLTG